jgi:hypothetical protein
MIEFIIDYLWNGANTCTKVTKSLVKFLCADQTGDGRNTRVTHFVWKAIKDSNTVLLRNEELVRLRYRSLLVENVLQILCIGRNLHGVQHRDVDIHLPDHIYEATELFIFHMLLLLVRE